MDQIFYNGTIQTMDGREARAVCVSSGKIAFIGTDAEALGMRSAKTELIDLGGRLKRLETATALLNLNKDSTKTVLSSLQDADIVESGTNLQMAETALEASLAVTTRAMKLTVLDYI